MYSRPRELPNLEQKKVAMGAIIKKHQSLPESESRFFWS